MYQPADYWSCSKRLLLEPTLLQQLQQLDPDGVPDVTVEKLNIDIVQCPDMDPVLLTKVSQVAEAFGRWIRALVEYRLVTKVSILVNCVEYYLRFNIFT